MRLDKFIANNTDYSRSQVRKLVKDKRVEINNAVVADVSCAIDEHIDIIFIDGKAVTAVGDLYLMLHKPQGYVCATSDADHPTVLDLIDKSNIPKTLNSALSSNVVRSRLQIAGRLDIDTTGLVLLTNNGSWNHKITSPSSQCKKSYIVTLANPIDITISEIFAKGIQLEGEKKKTLPAFIEVITHKKIRLSIFEGKYHQVKRMFAAVGNRVRELHRESIGNIVLDTNLASGEYRALTEKEVKSVIDTSSSSNPVSSLVNK